MSAALLQEVEGILRSGGREAPAFELSRGRRAILYFLICGSGYGALMGTFGGIYGDRLLLILYAALKVPLLLIVTGAVCMPSFFVLNTLLGLRADFSRVLHALLMTQAAFAVVLLSLVPFTLFWYASSADYNQAILFNTLIFGVASLAAQWLLRRHYRPLIAENPRHAVLLYAWLGLFAFVGIQTAWTLRPFVGSPDLPAQFFREGAWGNAYVALAEKVRDLFQ